VLQDNGSSSNFLSDDTSGAVGAEVAGISCGVDFTGCEEDDWGAWIALSVLSAHGDIIRTRQNIEIMPERDISPTCEQKANSHSGIIRTRQKYRAHAKERHQPVVTFQQKAKEQLPLGTLI
jgi:hypothetical protein